VRIGALAQTPLEWLALTFGWLPTPLIDTHLAVAHARALMAATRLGLFEELAAGEADASTIAKRIGTHPEATERLVFALVGAGALRPGRVGERVALTRISRRYLTRGSPHQVIDKVLFSYHEWRVNEGYDAYLEHGAIVDLHALLDRPVERLAVGEADPLAWRSYQLGLRAVAGVSAREVAWWTPVPRRARRMLDIGGAHGHFAAALLRRHPRLSGEILELPQAVAASAEMMAAEGVGERLRHRVGNAMRDPLGEGYDLVFASQFNHHLSDAENRTLAARVAAALRPGGIYVIQDLARPQDPRDARRAQLGALLDLYFGASSGAGTYRIRDMQGWQRGAGLVPLRPRWLRTLPGLVQQAARRPLA